MSIINKADFKIESLYWRLSDWDEHNYWYTTNLNIPNNVIEMICSTDNLFLLVCDEFEARTDLFHLINKLPIPKHKIVLISENYDLSGIDYWTHIGEMGVKFQTLQNNAPITLEKKKYTKSFLNLNRRWRTHRPCFVGLLHSMNLLDKGLVSLGRSDDNLNWNNIFHTVSNLLREDDELYELFVSNKETIVSLPEMYLDTTDLYSTRDRILLPDVSYTDTLKLYQETYFSVASETFFFDSPGRFFSEKTFKPIAFKHPFILMSHPNSLELLHTLGYKTFHPFIDESYDKETNDVSRLKMILKEVERLSNLSDTEIEQFIDVVKPITKYNFSNLLRKNNNQYIHRIG